MLLLSFLWPSTLFQGHFATKTYCIPQLCCLIRWIFYQGYQRWTDGSDGHVLGRASGCHKMLGIQISWSCYSSWFAKNLQWRHGRTLLQHKICQIGMNGPNVNLKMYKNLVLEVEDFHIRPICWTWELVVCIQSTVPLNVEKRRQIGSSTEHWKLLGNFFMKPVLEELILCHWLNARSSLQSGVLSDELTMLELLKRIWNCCHTWRYSYRVSLLRRFQIPFHLSNSKLFAVISYMKLNWSFSCQLQIRWSLSWRAFKQISPWCQKVLKRALSGIRWYAGSHV